MGNLISRDPLNHLVDFCLGQGLDAQVANHSERPEEQTQVDRNKSCGARYLYHFFTNKDMLILKLDGEGHKTI